MTLAYLFGYRGIIVKLCIRNGKNVASLLSVAYLLILNGLEHIVRDITEGKQLFGRTFYT